VFRQFKESREVFADTQWQAKPQLAKRTFSRGAAHDILNPANGEDVVGTVTYATERQIDAAFKAAKPWTAPVAERAEILRRASDALELRHAELFALLAREAGKTAADAVALRYYADQAELHSGDPRGIIITIAPWNFPLAIFLGQIAAALAAGNAVLAKPAEATCLIASVAVDILYAAGVPKTALQNLPGEGSVIGAALTSDERANGVVFTGSTKTAQIINKNVAKNLVPSALLIAETGGINCMVVDSTALPQQAVTDIIASAFQSAGQRCSALRLLYIQDDIYDLVIDMLIHAMDELKLGQPWDMDTDIGPVIDEPARARFSDYIAHSNVLYQEEDLPDIGHFIQPTLIEVSGRSDVKDEIFGPVLHVAKFEPEDLPKIVNEINAADYSLTFGLHTRIDTRVDDITRALHVGNIYVNRNQIGAVVGSHFISGRTLCLGPDVELQMNLVAAAGGVGVPFPNLKLDALEHLEGFASVIHWGDVNEQRAARQALARRSGPIIPLATGKDIHWAITAEQHICIDTTASGGNTELLSGGDDSP